jgi:hypothetical protein
VTGGKGRRLTDLDAATIFLAVGRTLEFRRGLARALEVLEVAGWPAISVSPHGVATAVQSNRAATLGGGSR